MKEFIGIIGLVLLWFSFSCESRQSETIPTLPSQTDRFRNEGFPNEAQNSETPEGEDQKTTQETSAMQVEIVEALARIKELNEKIANDDLISEAERQELKKQSADLQKIKTDLEAQLTLLLVEQAALKKQLAENSNAKLATGSGFPFCGAKYYGIVFDCNGKKCAKSDPAYVNICELSANSAPAASSGGPSSTNGASGYPLCGSQVYGQVFGCNGRQCAKSDPNYVNICEISGVSAASSTGGSSGFPQCGAKYYGDLFNCNGRTCAKSDPAYLNICEISGVSAASSTGGSSGFPLCGAKYYGDLFNCNGRTCAKSDPAYVNICQVQ